MGRERRQGEHRRRQSLGCLWGQAVGCEEEQRRCWEASREEQETSLSITSLLEECSFLADSHGAHRPPDVCLDEVSDATLAARQPTQGSETP